MPNDCNNQSQSTSEQSSVYGEYPVITSQQGFKNSWKREKSFGGNIDNWQGYGFYRRLWIENPSGCKLSLERGINDNKNAIFQVS